VLGGLGKGQRLKDELSYFWVFWNWSSHLIKDKKDSISSSKGHYSSLGRVPLESWQEAGRDTQYDLKVFLIVEGQLRLSPVELPHSPRMMGVMHRLFCKYCAVGDGGDWMKKHSEKPLWKTQ